MTTNTSINYITRLPDRLDWDGSRLTVADWEAVADVAATERIEAGLCVHPACGLTVAGPAALTCGDPACAAWLAWMPDMARGYLYEVAAGIRAAQLARRSRWWERFGVPLAASVTGGGVVVAAFAAGVWLGGLHITA